MQETAQQVTNLLTDKRSFKENLIEVVSICSKKPHQLLDEYLSPEALINIVFVDLFLDNTNSIKADILVTFIDSGKSKALLMPKFQQK